MSTRFAIDLLHPGRIAETWKEWFVGAQGSRRLAMLASVAVGALVVGLIVFVLPPYWRLSGETKEIDRLNKKLAATQADVRVLRTNLGALSAEAKRQLRWAEVLDTLSRQTPPNVKLLRVELVRVTPAPAQPPAPGQPPPAAPEGTLRIDALTPLRPGPPPLLEIAQFMAGLMRDPAVNRRFQLKSWEISPPTGGGPEGGQLLQIKIVLSERSL